MNSFFNSTMFKPKALRPFQECGLCGLSGNCRSPKIPVTGLGKKSILLVGEFPEQQDDIHNEHFTGEAGDILRKYLNLFGLHIEKDCWGTSASLCYSKEVTETQIQYCRTNLLQNIKEKDPSIIVLLGNMAVKSLLGLLWKGTSESYRQWFGWLIPSHNPNAWICPIINPAEILYSPKDKVLVTLLKKQIKNVSELEGRPWSTPPRFSQQITVETSPSKARKKLKELLKESGPISFDYETNKLKPDGNNAKIHTGSVSNGRTTIAFPWTTDTSSIVSKILRSEKPKYAHNMKFEDRWTKAMLGHPVNNWHWDSMLAAHILNNGTSVSLKFQSFVNFGLDSYDEHLKPFLQQTDNAGINRIKDIPIQELLLYNGLDSLMTFKLARKQMRILSQ